MKHLVGNTIDYAESHKDVLPSEANWMKVLTPYYRGWDRDFTECKFSGRLGTVKHTFNSRWSNTKLSDIPDPASAILIYDAIDGKPAYRRRTYYRNLYERLRNSLERPGIGVAYVDGRRRWVSNRLTPEMIAEGHDPFWPKREWWKL